jgi:hypothetical protein
VIETKEKGIHFDRIKECSAQCCATLIEVFVALCTRTETVAEKDIAATEVYGYSVKHIESLIALGGAAAVSIYAHVLVAHAPNMIREFGDLVARSTESLEALGQARKRIVLHSTNGKPCGNEDKNGTMVRNGYLIQAQKVAVTKDHIRNGMYPKLTRTEARTKKRKGGVTDYHNTYKHIGADLVKKRQQIYENDVDLDNLLGCGDEMGLNVLMESDEEAIGEDELRDLDELLETGLDENMYK